MLLTTVVFSLPVFLVHLNFELIVGGFVDPRLEVRLPYPNDTHSPPVRGIFATEAIANEELLLNLPWDATIIVADESNGDGDTFDPCAMGRAIRRELALGDESRFAPYVRLLNEQRTKGLIGIPNAWSGQGLDLLQKIVGPNLTPNDVRRHLHWWEQSCGGSIYSDKLGADATLLQVARAIGLTDWTSEVKEGEERKKSSALAPFYDLLNHRNGLWQNTRVISDLYKKYFKLYAMRDIEKGEQLYYGYGEGTDELFRDYGFVERMPQKWSFTIPESTVDGTKYDAFPVSFRLNYENSVEGSNLTLQWLDLPKSVYAADYFFRQEHERLVSGKKWYDEHPDELEVLGIPEEEKAKIWEYHHALTTALSSVGQAMEKGLPSNVVNGEAEESSESSEAGEEAAAAAADGHGDEL